MGNRSSSTRTESQDNDSASAAGVTEVPPQLKEITEVKDVIADQPLGVDSEETEEIEITVDKEHIEESEEHEDIPPSMETVTSESSLTKVIEPRREIEPDHYQVASSILRTNYISWEQTLFLGNKLYFLRTNDISDRNNVEEIFE